MKVKELIKLLEQFDGESEVELLFRHEPNYANYGMYKYEEAECEVKSVTSKSVKMWGGGKAPYYKEFVVIAADDGFGD